MPKVSVIIPVYNGEKFIENALKSVLAQTFQDFEIIVVDDASTDRTKEIIREFQKNDTRIKLIKLEKNSGGPSMPTNVGIKNSQGELIAILEVDDFYLPNFLTERVKKIEKENLDWLIGGAFYFYFPQKALAKYVTGGSVSTWLIKKPVLKQGGYFRPEQDGVQDMGFSLRVSKPSNNVKVSLDPAPLTCCLVHQESQTYFAKEKNKIFLRRINSLLSDFGELSSIESLLYWRLGSYYCIDGKMKIGREYFIKSLKLKFNFISVLSYLLSFLGPSFYFYCWAFLKAMQTKLEKLRSLYWVSTKYNFEYKTAKTILSKL